MKKSPLHTWALPLILSLTTGWQAHPARLPCRLSAIELEFGRPLLRFSVAPKHDLEATLLELASRRCPHDLASATFTASLVRQVLAILASSKITSPEEKAELWDFFAAARRHTDRHFRSNHLSNDNGDFWFVGNSGYLLIIDQKTGEIFRGTLSIAQANWEVPRTRATVSNLSPFTLR